MGYNLWFGDFHADVDKEERWARGSAAMPDKPAPVEPPYDSTGAVSRSSECSPGYAGWHTFAARHGLDDVFFGMKNGEMRGGGAFGEPVRKPWWGPKGEEENNLIQEHPGAVALTEKHYQRFVAARDAHPVKYDEAARSLEEWHKACQEHEGSYIDRPDLDVKFWDALRLNWLVYWTRHTLDNCEYPTFANS